MISAPPVNQFSIKTIETPTLSGSYNIMQPSSYSYHTYATPTIPTMPSTYLTPNVYKPTLPAPKIEPSNTSATTSSSAGGTKRDASGAVKSVPTTAAAAATAVAAAQIEADKKKAKDAKDKKNKNKKFIRSAGGQTWEDESLLEWDPGKLLKENIF